MAAAARRQTWRRSPVSTYAGGGGGGSGFGPSGTTYESGVQTGDGQVTITPADPGVGCVTATLQVQKVVGFNSEVGFVEHVTCDVANEGSMNVDLPFLSDGTPDEAHGPSDWTVVDGKWQLEFFVQDISCTVTETDQGDANWSDTRVRTHRAEAAGVAPADLPEAGCPGLSAGPGSDPTDSGTVVLEGAAIPALLTVYNDLFEPTLPEGTPGSPRAVESAG